MPAQCTLTSWQIDRQMLRRQMREPRALHAVSNRSACTALISGIMGSMGSALSDPPCACSNFSSSTRAIGSQRSGASGVEGADCRVQSHAPSAPAAPYMPSHRQETSIEQAFLCVQQLQQQHAGEGGASVRKPPGRWGMTAEGRAIHYPAPTLMADLNDEVCRICWQGVSMSGTLSYTHS